MAQSFGHLLTVSDVDGILTNPTVLQNKPREGRSQVDFSVDISQEVAERLSNAFGWRMSPTVPLRWIHGDSAPHTDHSWDHVAFDTTYLVYLTDSDGVLYVGEDEYPITAGHGYSFREGLLHGTRNATEDRLLMGPFNERQMRVGRPPGIAYFGSSQMLGDAYYQEMSTGSGTLLTISQINAMNGNQSTIRVPAGRRHIGWVFSASNSYGTALLNGVLATDGASYPVNSSYFTIDNASISVYPLFGRDVRWSRLGRGSWPPGRHGRGRSFIVSA